MLWMKGWFETRWRFLFVIAIFLAALIMSSRNGVSSESSLIRMMTAMGILWIFITAFLAGAGIKTQAAFQTVKGLHGSTYFTLSLPVSRFRLLAIRAGIGFLEVAAVILVTSGIEWALFPIVRASSTPADLAKLILSSCCCTAGFYALGVLAATFLDDMWQVWGTLIAIVAINRLTALFPPPPSLDVFRAIGSGSPLLTHSLPWGAMAISLGFAAILFAITAKVIRERQY